VAPVRSNVNQLYDCQYNITTKEISYGTKEVNWTGSTNTVGPYYAVVGTLGVYNDGSTGGSITVRGQFGGYLTGDKSYIQFTIASRDAVTASGTMINGFREITTIVGYHDFYLNQQSNGRYNLVFKVNAQYSTWDFYVSCQTDGTGTQIYPASGVSASVPAQSGTQIASIFTTTYITLRNVNGNLSLGGGNAGLFIPDRVNGTGQAFQWYTLDNYFRVYSHATSQDVLHVTNDGRTNNRTGVWGTISDVRLKENVETARDYLDDINKLRVVKYSLIDDHLPKANMLGFIAQEIEQVFPNLVDEYSGMKSVKSSILTPMLVSCVQELTKKNAMLEERLARLEQLILGTIPTGV
jgi:hypothetical protein